ncbi:YehR family lipoprotein [Vagococcus fluvialis]|uniref:YehR family lipoprotein n=1 Tax=Vagococcus fluvialis TaxID=2738 RepID=UPI003B594BB7
MKKLWKLVLLVGFIVTLGACSKEETTTFELEIQKGITAELTYYHKGDKVFKQTAHNEVDFKTVGIEDKKMAEEMYSPIAKEYEGIKGIEHSLKFTDKNMTEILTIDYEKLDFDAAKNVPGIMLEGNGKNGVSLKASKELLESQGFKEKK